MNQPDPTNEEAKKEKIMNEELSPKPATEALRSCGHSGDCTIFASLCNNEPTDGICTCGYGLSLVREGNWGQMFSKELILEHNHTWIEEQSVLKKMQMKDDDSREENQINPK